MWKKRAIDLDFTIHVKQSHISCKLLYKRGVGQMLTKADEGGGGVSQMLTIADGGGRGVQESLILADVICEQPLIWEFNGFIIIWGFNGGESIVVSDILRS